jgi:hypothetical protein
MVLAAPALAFLKGWSWLEGRFIQADGVLRDEIEQVKAEHQALTGEEL